MLSKSHLKVNLDNNSKKLPKIMSIYAKTHLIYK